MSARARIIALWLLGVGAPGAACGAAFAIGAGQAASMGAPDGWTRTQPRAAYVSPGLLGELPPTPGAWSLARFEALVGPRGRRTLKVTADIPDPGELQVYVDGSDPGTPGGPMVVLRRGGRASTPLIVEPQRGERPLSCTGDAGPAAEGPTTATLTIGADGFTAETPGGTLRCPEALRGGHVALAAGLGRVRIQDIVLDGVPAGLPAAHVGRGAGVGALVALLVGGFLRWLGVGPLGLAFAFAPLWASALLAGGDPVEVYEIVRVPHRRGVWQLAGLVGLLPAAVAATVTLAWRAAGVLAAGGRRAWGLAGGVGVAAAVLVAAGGTPAPAPGLALVAALALAGGAAKLLARGPAPSSAVVAAGLVALAGAATAVGMTSGVARLYLALAGASVGGLVWLTRHASRVRFYNLASLGLFATTLGAAEVALRWTELGRRWDGRDPEQSGSADTVVSQFDALERGDFSDYPSAGFPTRYGPRSAPVRVVCLGGSSTGGAFQNDSLDTFYPARLDALAGPQVEVVNQGAGSWSSFHVREYGEHWLERAEADVVTVYLGVNEAQRTPVTYRDLHARWKAGRLRTTPGPLAGIRLLHGLRYATRGLRGRGELAVPPEDFDANLRDLAARVTGAGDRLLLMPEAAYPSAEAFGAYAQAMRNIAEEVDGVEFLDTATAVLDGGSGMFLDQNHLSDTGHDRLAHLMLDRLTALGWLDAPAADRP